MQFAVLSSCAFDGDEYGCHILSSKSVLTFIDVSRIPCDKFIPLHRTYNSLLQRRESRRSFHCAENSFPYNSE